VHTALITGCQTGFGHLLTRRLLIEGYRVIATDAHTDALAERLLDGLHTEAGARLTVCPLDVRESEAVRSLAQAQSSPVNLVINNAGFGLFGTQEETNLDDVRDLFDVNVFGPARVTQAFLPQLRATRGTLVQISSLAGRMVFPESGYYAATKHALDALSQAVALEAAPLGVRLRVVEPGAFATEFYETAAQRSPDRIDESPYRTLRDLWDGWREEVLEPPQDPEQVVEAIVASLESPLPFLRIPVGEDAKKILAMLNEMGASAWIEMALDRCGGRGQSPGS